MASAASGWVGTIPIGPDSIAIGAADVSSCPATDARGQSRPLPPTPCDVGAYQATTGTTLTVDANVNPAGYGVPVTVTVTVAHPTGLPTGSVEAHGPAGRSARRAHRVGQATFTLEDLDPGDYDLVATYVPDGPLEADSDDLSLTIVKQISATVLTVDPAGTSAVGAPVSLSATVHDGADVSGPVPTGEVEFRSGSDVVATATIVAGVATADDVTLAGSLHSLTAVYSGDTGFEGSTSGAVPHSVQSGTSVDLTVAAAATYRRVARAARRRGGDRRRRP